MCYSEQKPDIDSAGPLHTGNALAIGTENKRGSTEQREK